MGGTSQQAILEVKVCNCIFFRSFPKNWQPLTENDASLRRSRRPTKGTGGLERMQMTSDQVTHQITRKRKDAPLDEIPLSTTSNPMAPQPKKPRGKQKVLP